jgi:hypothetical protein
MMATGWPFPLAPKVPATEHDMWITCEHKHFMALAMAKCDTVYVDYKGPANYAVIATIGHRDICIKANFGCAKDAVEFAQTLINGL